MAGESGTLRLWNTTTRELLWERQAHADLIYDVAWSPDGKRLYTASGDRRVGVFSAEGEILAYLEGHSDQVLCVAVSAGGFLATGCLDGTLKIWRDGVVERTLTRHGGRVTSLAFHPRDVIARVTAHGFNLQRSSGRSGAFGLTEDAPRLARALMLNPDGRSLLSRAWWRLIDKAITPFSQHTRYFLFRKI